MLLHEWNLKDAVAFAEERGEGRGMKKGKMEIAKKMKATGDSIDRIIELTGLTVDDILRL